MKNIDNNFIVIQGWMVSKLELKGNELLAFALIFGFCQDGETEFRGSLKYISSWLNCSKSTTIRTIDVLIEKKLIIKKQDTINDVSFNRYSINLDLSKMNRVVSNCDRGGIKMKPGGGVKMKPNNIELDIYTDIDSNNTPNLRVFESEITSILEKLNDLSGRQLPTTGQRSESNRGKVRSLLKKNYTVAEISDVIQLKCYEWGNNPEMFQYLHPTTLFRPSNFQKYLDCLNDLKSNPQKASQFKKKINELNNRNSGPSAKDIISDETIAAVIQDLHNEGFYDQRR